MFYQGIFLILHGWGSSSRKWERIKERLEKTGFSVFVPDLPGFGECPLPPQPWSLADYVEWVKDYCEQKNISKCFLVGHSFGGAIAIKFALNYPEKINKIFLVAPAAVRKKKITTEIIAKISRLFTFLPPLVKRIIYSMVLRSDYPYKESVMKETFKKVIAEDLSEVISNIKVPTIIIWGDKDDITPIKDAYFLKEKIANSTLEIIKGASHILYLEYPEKINAILLQHSK